MEEKIQELNIVLVTGGELKRRVINNAFSKLVPGFKINIIESDVETSNVHIISKESCLNMMREKIKEVASINPNFSYIIFMRGRFDDFKTHMEECALVLITDKQGRESYSQAASFLVPEEISNLVRQGVSFSKAVEKVTNSKNVKEGSGYVGLLTKGVVSKEEQYFQPVAIALSALLS